MLCALISDLRTPLYLSTRVFTVNTASYQPFSCFPKLNACHITTVAAANALDIYLQIISLLLGPLWFLQQLKIRGSSPGYGMWRSVLQLALSQRLVPVATQHSGVQTKWPDWGCPLPLPLCDRQEDLCPRYPYHWHHQFQGEPHGEDWLLTPLTVVNRVLNLTFQHAKERTRSGVRLCWRTEEQYNMWPSVVCTD